MNAGKILSSAAIIGVVGALVIGGTQAFFSDEEASTGNVFAAGAIDLRIDNHAWYNGLECTDEGRDEGDYVWQDPGGNAGNDPYLQSLVGTPCQSTWDLKDLDSGDLFFNLQDLKPGDWEEDTISIHVDNNDAWVCANLKVTSDDDMSSTEPELEDNDTEEDPQDTWDGELGQELNFIFWADDGDNVYESDETIVLEGTPSDLDGYGSDDDNNGETFPLADASFNVWADGAQDTPLPAGNDAVYIGKAFCFGEFTLDPVAQGDNSPANNPGFSCNGAPVTNQAQTDKLMGDLRFYAVQSRNNADFQCTSDVFGDTDVVDTREAVGAVLSAYVAPTNCTVEVDDDGNANFTSIQTAIDAAVDGDVICVDEGTYNEFTVDKPLTIAGLVNPTNSATVVPSGTGVEQLALVTASDVTITGLHFNGDGVALDGNQAAGVQISPVGASLDNVNVVYNLIENLNVDGGNTTASNKGIQWFTETDSGFSLTNSSFTNNVINNITSNSKGSYGVQTVGDMDSVVIAYNTISNIDGAWEAGIGIDSKDTTPSSLTGVSINHNQIETGIATFSIQVEKGVAGSGLVINQNNLDTLLYGGSSGIPSADILDAENNWWGTATPGAGAAGPDVFLAPDTNVVDFDPAEASAFPVN